MPAIKVGDTCKVVKHPVGRDLGVVTEIKLDVPYPFYLSSGQKDNDMGPYSASEIEVIPRVQDKQR